MLGVTFSLLAEQGFRGMSVDRVAALAGVSKPTIYRRWPSKAALATAALAHRAAHDPPLVGEGATPDALTAMLEALRERLLAANAMALVGTLLAEERHAPDLMHLFRERLWQPYRRSLRAALDAAHTRGEIRPGADLDATVAMMSGALHATYLAEGTIPASWPRRIVRTVWRGIGVSPPPSPRS